MKNIALAFCLSILLSSCSSGSSVSAIPPVITGLFSGPFESANGLLSGTFIMNLAEDNDGNIQGTLQVGFDQAVEASCVAGLNTTISGSVSGFNVSLTTGEGEEGGGSITFQLTSADNTLSGTYVTSGICSNFTGTGTVSLAR